MPDPLSKPPLNLLINPEAIRKKRPWEIDIAGLLDTFLEMVKGSELLDLRLCGSVAASSALIYRLKVENLFLFEKLRVERRMVESTEPPYLLEMPFRYELYSTSIDELMQAFKRVLEELLAEQETERPKTVTTLEPILEVDPFSLQIKELLASFRSKLIRTLEQKGELLFSNYIEGMGVREAIQSFILLLFVATEGLVGLDQIGEDIRIVRKAWVDR